jgi:hypothetical protein
MFIALWGSPIHLDLAYAEAYERDRLLACGTRVDLTLRDRIQMETDKRRSEIPVSGMGRSQTVAIHATKGQRGLYQRGKSLCVQ